MENPANKQIRGTLIHPDRVHIFPRAGRYAGEPDQAAANIRDPRAGGRSFGYSERHLQAVWFDPRWRPPVLKTAEGEEIRIESPGNWNLEAGPDFIGACIEAGPGRRRLSGDVEVHIFPSGWKQHGHDHDPRYRNVCLHLTYFEGTLPAEALPAGALQVALRPALRMDPGFAFDHIDISAYPYAGRAEEPPCRQLLSAWPVEARMALLESAGQARLKRKADRLFAAISERGVDQVFYENMLAALGYQHNKVSFAKLASAVPLELLCSMSGGNEQVAYAILAGVAGLLPSSFKPGWDGETREYVRVLWDAWWKLQSGFPVRLERAEWQLTGMRPANHPLRRFAAAARIFCSGTGGIQRIEHWFAGEPRRLIERMQATLDPGVEGYWEWHHTLGGQKSTHPVSLVGRERWELIALNVAIPFAVACGFSPHQVQAVLASIKPEPDNTITRQTAFYLLGRDYPSRMLDDATRRQGLQQIFHDYCLNDRSRCQACPLPGRLAGWLHG